MDDTKRALSLWLDRLMLRSTLDDIEQEAIMDLPGDIATIAANRDFVRLCERADHSCLIVTGLAGRFGQTRNGERLITALHIPGDMADLHSLPLPEATSALNALVETTILRVPHRALRTLLDQRPSLADVFWRDCMVDAAILSEWALRNGRLPAKGRIAHLMCELSHRIAVGDCRDGLNFDWPLSQVQLADATGLTSIHTNRMLRELREAEIARIRDKRLEIVDWRRLCAIAEFSPHYLQLGCAATGT